MSCLFLHQTPQALQMHPEGTSPYGTPGLATSTRSNLFNLDDENKQFHLLVQKLATSVLVLTTLS